MRAQPRARTQPMAGFEDHFSDIVDYVVRTSDEIWMDQAVGRIYETFDAGCTIYSDDGIARSVEDVMTSTLATLNDFPNPDLEHLSIAWSGDEDRGFHASHLGSFQAVNSGASRYGPALGQTTAMRFCFDCVILENRIHTGWLVCDNGALVRQLGLDIHATAQQVANQPSFDIAVVSVSTRLDGQAPRRWYDGPTDTIEGWVAHHFDQVWNARRLDHVAFHYAADAVVHWAGGRTAHGPREIGTLIVSLLASLPDSTLRVERLSWSDETDGVILAARWILEGTLRSGGALGDVPGGKPVSVMGASHMRFGNGYIVEEWTVFDEIAVLAQAYRS